MNDQAKVARSVARARASPLQSVYDRLPVGFALFGTDLRLAAWNAPFAALCDYPRKLVKAGTPLESFVRVDAERGELGTGPVDALARQQLAALKRRRRTERELVRSDGRILRIASERLPGGGLLVTCEDVSEARRAAEQRRLSEERYDVAMRAINEGLYDWDIVNDTVHYSDRVYQAVGLSADDYTTAAGWFERIHPDDQARYRNATRAHFRGETDRFECDYRYRWRDGSWHWARQHGLAVRDASGRAVRLVGSTGDITELKERERELAEHVAEQTAVRELLEAISRSAFDLDAVLRTLIESAARLCHAERAFIFRRDSDAYRLAVDYGGVTPEFREFIAQHPIRPGRDTLVGRTALTKAVVHIEDVLADPEYRWPQSQRMGGQRSMLGVPIVRDDAVVGVIALWKERVEPFTPAQIQLVATFSSQAAIAIENARLFGETREALAQQTAISEILQVVARSPTELQPVLDAVVASAAQLCEARDAHILQVRGDALFVTASHGEFPITSSSEPVPIRWGLVSGRAVLGRELVHVPDIASAEARAEFPESARYQQRFGDRTVIGVPLLREGSPIGLILIRRQEMRPFTDKQIVLLKTFADQAVIAIENVRLFQELQTKNRELMDLLEQQTATAEILKVISSSPTDIRPVLRALAENAARLCGTADSFIAMADGPVLRLAASVGPFGRTFGPDMAIPIVRGTASGRAVLDRKTIHVLDLAAEVAVEYPQATEFQRRYGHRSLVATPLTSGDAVLGVINVLRKEVRPFTDRQIALLRTFADQAAIAIKNVRLFNETKEALERQTATAEILKVISSSPTDVGPVFDAIIRSASRLAGGSSVNVSRLAEEHLHLAAYTPVSPAADDVLRSAYPVHISEAGPIAEAVRTRSPSFVGDWEADPDLSGKARETMRARGFRSTLYVPIMHREEVLGLMHVSKVEPGPFPLQWVDLLKTFADQAAIAIENVRLFNETKEALERQTATAEILRVISESPGDLEPVFRAILERATELCDAQLGIVFRWEGERFYVVATRGEDAKAISRWKEAFAAVGRPGPHSGLGRLLVERKPVHIPDILEEAAYREGDALRMQTASILRARSFLAVPLLKNDAVIGAVVIYRREVRPFSARQIELVKVFADQAVIAIENVRLFNETKEALERQTATAEILKVISSSPTDVQPVFDAIVSSGVRLFQGVAVGLRLVKGDRIERAAFAVGPGCQVTDGSRRPLALDEQSFAGRAILRAQVVHSPDVFAEEWAGEAVRANARRGGWRATAAAPMLREGRAIGAIIVMRDKPAPYSESEIALLRTFADQAVIAIENARLFNETKEALERQTATAEILKVISSSPTDVQPVLDAVAERAGKLCDAPYANVTLADDDALRVMSVYSTEPGPRPDQRNFVPLRRTFLNARAVLDREVIHIPDVVPLIDTEFPDIRRNQQKFGFRAVLVVPLLREGRAVGTIFLWRRAPGPFSDDQVALLKTFADQAVIAIENVRLFKETKEALERQTATADVLASISGSLTDTQPVFERIVKNLRELFGTRFAVLQLLRGDVVEMPAVYGSPGFERLRDRYPRPLDDTTVGGRAMLSKQTLQFAPVLDNPATPSATIGFARDFGFNSVIFTPMIHEGTVIGAIGAAHPGAKGFDERQVALLKTFADQAVIAIQNARLFQELQARNRDLTESLEQQTATAEILRVISNSPTDITPVLDAVAESAARLCEANDVVVMMNEGDALRAVKSSGPFGERFGSGFTIPITRGSAAGRAVIERSTVQVADFESASDEEFPVGREHRRIYGNHGAMATPLLHGDVVLGVIAVLRRDVRPFSDRQRTLLQTFADQAAIAIANVRLFNETKEALEQQTATGEILRVISSSPTDLAPVFDAVAKSVSRLCDAPDVVIVRAEGGSMRFAASVGPFGQTFGRELAVPLARGTVAGRAVLERRTVHVDDLAAEPEDEYPEGKVLQRRYGHRTMMAAPLLLGDSALGAIAVLRKEVRPFSEKQVALLRTFADQSVIAIENVRLFNETKEALEKQTAISEILRVISASPTDVQPVFDAIVRSAVILCGSKDGAVFRYDGERLHYAAGFDQTPEWVDAVQSRYPMHPETSTIAGRAILTLSVAQIDDVLADPAYDHERAIKGGWRRMLAVPMLREGVPLGVIVVSWPQPGPTPKSQEELLKTFADQAVIAIENVRLFNEIRDKSHQLEIANQHKSAFLANMSHELRTPLNAVIGFSEMLAARYFGDLTEKQAEYVNDIHGSGKHLLSLINDILDLSKIEAGRMELEAVEFDLRAALENAITLVRERAQRGGVALRLDTGPELGAFRGDERKLKQVVLNLLSNAVKFTPRGGAVDVSARRADGAVEIAVRDSGAGIAPEDHEAIFEAFRQVGTDATRKREGTGLGLALTRRFVELHGGTIRVESAVGKGSTFTVRLPIHHGE